ncbi:MAG: FlgO family outer membrane protein, partial [Desulfobulbaceae bacterium]|nr:FlgO family outer membrane protein [Desulfobulbaceae bacterium]
VAPPTATIAKTVPSVYKYTPDASNSLGTEKQLSEFCREVAGKVYYELKQDGDKHLTARVAVVDAVPLSDLKRETEFGRLISEYMLTDLADRGLKVTELRMGKEINILPQTGEFILSRNIGELATDAPMLDYVLVSTFTNTRKTLILQGRLVGLKSGLVETSWRYTLPLNRELLGLFHTPEQPYTIAVNGMNR